MVFFYQFTNFFTIPRKKIEIVPPYCTICTILYYMYNNVSDSSIQYKKPLFGDRWWIDLIITSPLFQIVRHRTLLRYYCNPSEILKEYNENKRRSYIFINDAIYSHKNVWWRFIVVSHPVCEARVTYWSLLYLHCIFTISHYIISLYDW